MSAPPVAAEVLLAIVLALLLALCVYLGVVAYGRQRALRAARAAERSFRDLYANISEGVFRSTLDGRMLGANPALVRLNGFSSEAEMLRSVNDIAGQWYVDPKRRTEIHELLLKNGQVTDLISEVYRYKTRERIWISESTRLVRDETTGAPLCYEGTVREVTEAVRRLELQERLSRIASIIPGCLYEMRVMPDGSRTVEFASDGLSPLLGLTPEMVKRDPDLLRDAIHPDDLALVTESFDQAARTMSPRQCEYRLLTVDGEVKWALGHGVPRRDPDGSTVWYGLITDITERKRSEARIYDLAYYDSLTRLPNRAMLLERLEAAIREDAAAGWSGALVFIDLDQFKVLNETKGHLAGDRLLCAVAERISGETGKNDLAVRLGGDEFAVLVKALPSDAREAHQRVDGLARAVVAAIGEPFQIDDQPFHSSASVGVTFFGDRGETTSDTLRRADLALYEAKGAEPGAIRFFEPRMEAVLAERLALTTDLRNAIVQHELSVAYQGIFDVEGRCTGAEMLLRWQHPLRGEIKPSEFLPLAERSGLMAQIDAFVVHTACNTLTAWRTDPQLSRLKLAINVGARQLNQRGFATMLETALIHTGADASLLTLELTEHVMLDDFSAVVTLMRRLKQLGVRIALDDFGTGYSSLSYLKKLPIDMLKIDQSFVRDLERDPSDRVIVQTILNIARALQVSVVAEGVESEMQAMILRQFGCQGFQGYHFGRPMPLDDFVTSLDSRETIGGGLRLIVGEKHS